MSLFKFPGDVLSLIYSELQARRYVLTFRLVCRAWNAAGKRADANKLREQKFANTCDTCGMFGKYFSVVVCFDDLETNHLASVGEFECEVCLKNLYCHEHRPLQKCIRCEKRPGNCCWMDEIPLCYRCAPENCEQCHEVLRGWRTTYDYCQKSKLCLCPYCHVRRGCCEGLW